jgi:steroid delta-isomerase-like uncharacterized protein
VSPEENKDRVYRWYEEGLNQGNTAVASEYLAAHFKQHVPGHDRPLGIADAKQGFLDLRLAFPDLRYALEDMIAEGDRVVVRWTAAGTNLAPLWGIAPTEKLAELSGISIYRMDDDRIAEEWTITDRLGLLRQLGAVAP